MIENSNRMQAIIEAERAAVEAHNAALPPTNGQANDVPQRPAIRPPRSAWPIRAATWVVVALNKPTLTALIISMLTYPIRLLLVGIGTWDRPGPLRVWLGGRVDREIYVARMASCGACPRAFTRVGENGRLLAGPFCGSCGCGEWFGAALKRKNKYIRWVCPDGRHESKTPLRVWHESLAEDDRGSVDFGQHPGRKATGCGARG